MCVETFETNIRDYIGVTTRQCDMFHQKLLLSTVTASVLQQVEIQQESINQNYK